ncbi:DUF2484 family protein [Tropicimonas sp. TH_r6]|uniref:DUF2484 family protein n=1 Tax=Tropicimonas sp. TH_r6 TaxID=3082085 RepID=UPI0029545904|nr:DUF2484 family protein [Tropicimonas sp. TH_r6]MDV7142610.1 DUF2484 family protein [Tropicimonas sp. TH_r6]
MSVLILACLWVLAAAAVAMLPLRYQYLPGIALLLCAVVLIWQIGATYGLLPLSLAAVAVVSMFRKPLRYLVLRLIGRSREEALSGVHSAAP